MRIKLAAVVLLLMAPACRSDKIELAYRFEPETTTKYLMTAAATATWEIGGPGHGSYTVTFEVTETTTEVDSEGATVEVLMTPVDVSEDGLPSPGPDPRSFTLRLGNSGEVREVIEVDGVPADALDPDQLAFIGTYRPPLAPEPVRLGDKWESSQAVELGSVFQEIVTTGELVALDRDEKGRKAILEYKGEGPLVWTTTLVQGAAELTGSATTASTATHDIDRRNLRTAHSVTKGTFEVRVVPTGTAPISGTLQLDLELDLERV